MILGYNHYNLLAIVPPLLWIGKSLKNNLIIYIKSKCNKEILRSTHSNLYIR